MQLLRLMIAAIVVAALFVGLCVLRREMGFEFSAGSLREVVAQMGVWGPLFYVGLVAFRVPLGLPSQVMLVGGGLVFGTVAGTLYGALGLAFSAVVLFVGSRWAGRATLEARLPERLRPLLGVASSRAGVAFIAVGTGFPFGPVTMYHLMAGVTAMTLGAFSLAALVGSLVRSWTYTFFGSTLASGDLDRIVQGVLLLGVAFVVPLLFPAPRSWLLQAVGRHAAPPPDAQSPESRL
jgi:uncharacterized membrane protein YdjX (TVP38/TMEM64 family)